MQNGGASAKIWHMTYAMVTGATGVLGTAFCRELAARGYGLFITGRSIEKLAALKAALTAEYPSANVDLYAADLSDAESRKALYSAAGKYAFGMLVNVAGADIQKPFSEYDEDKIAFQARACFEGAVSACAFALAHRDKSLKIINISSLCAEQPVPYFALYSAAKSALTTFSVALSKETEGTGVTVTCIEPGSVLTRPDIKEYISALGFWARKSAKTPGFVVEKSLKAAEKGKRKCIPGALNRLFLFFSRIAPRGIRLSYLARTRKNVRKDVF